MWWGKALPTFPGHCPSARGASRARCLATKPIPGATAARPAGFALFGGQNPALSPAGEGLRAPGSGCSPCSRCPLCPQRCPPLPLPWHRALFCAWLFWVKSLLIGSAVGALRLTMGKEPPGWKSRNLPGFDGLVGRSLGLQRTLRRGSIESRKGWHSPPRCPVFAGAFVNVRDNLLITTFIFICKTCLEDNLIVYYKRLLYLLCLSLSLPSH